MPAARGYSLIGLLVSMACLLILALVLMRALNTAMTGAGATLPGTKASFEDRQYLSALYQAMAASSWENDAQFLVPSDVAGRRDRSQDTTANLYSAMIAASYTVPGQLISGNENSPYVFRHDYDYQSYSPREGTHWDPSFSADLEVESNTSFAHVPLYGARLRNDWRFTASSTVPVIGNRGPAGGVDDPSSYTYGRDGRWAGHLVYGDGHVEHVTTFTPGGLSLGRGAEAAPDNIFAMEDGPSGTDVILTFTKQMTDDGPVIQHD